MLRDRKELEQTLTQVIIDSKLKIKKKQIKEIKTHLAQYDLFEGDIQSWINDPETHLHQIEDYRVLCLFTEQIYAKTSNNSIHPEEFFTSAEIEDSRKYSGLVEIKQNELTLPITFSNVQIVGNSAFMVTMDIKVIDQLLTTQILDYDFDLQREASYRRVKGVVTKEPTLNMKNVREISQHLQNDTLVPTVLVFNAATRSADSGTELIYDPKKLELSITKGTELFVVDGYHRCKASQNALQTNPNLSFNFAVLITNYTTRKAQQYQAQLAKATPISKVRIEELEALRLADTVVQQLKEESDLKGRISSTERVHFINNEIVTYNVLADTIEDQFKLDSRADAADVGDFLTEYFNFLIGSYSDEFINKVTETNKVSLINHNNFFIGYLTLGRRMMESGMKPRDVRKYIKNIDFSRSNSHWVTLGIVDEKGNITDTPRARKAIREYFENIEL